MVQVCLRQFYCSNEARVPPALVFSTAGSSSSRGSHWSTATAWEPHSPTAVTKDAQVFGWIWSMRQNWQNWVAGRAEDELEQQFWKYSLKNKEHKWSLTYRWFLWWNICIIFYIKFSSYFQLVLYAVSWTDADFSELNVFPLSESKQS